MYINVNADMLFSYLRLPSAVKHVTHANKRVRSKFHCQKDRQTDSPLRHRWTGKSEGVDTKLPRMKKKRSLKKRKSHCAEINGTKPDCEEHPRAAAN